MRLKGPHMIGTNVSLDRPPGLAPKGTSWGLGIIMLYWEAVPMFTLLGLIPFTAPGFGFVYAAIICPPLSLLVLIPMVLGFKSRRHWGVTAYFWCGITAIALLAIGIVMLGATLLYSLAHPLPMIGMTAIFGGALLVLTMFLPLLIRALRLRYWQPWTTPEQWEVGNEQIPEWALNAVGRTRR